MPSWVAPGIRFNDLVFSEPIGLPDWNPPQCPGLYAILAPDPNWAPKPFQVLWFGEFGNNASVASVRKESALRLHSREAKTLLIAVVALPFSTTAQRLALCRELVSAYNPTWQGQSEQLTLPRINPDLRHRIGFVPA